VPKSGPFKNEGIHEVHDMSRLKSDDYNKLAFYVAKLKALYALNDAIALGGRADEIIPRSVFLLRAEHMPLDVFGDNSADDFDEDLDEDL
jgi:hypothetical protein